MEKGELRTNLITLCQAHSSLKPKQSFVILLKFSRLEKNAQKYAFQFPHVSNIAIEPFFHAHSLFFLLLMAAAWLYQITRRVLKKMQECVIFCLNFKHENIQKHSTMCLTEN